ncbi:MAG: hypothetical protein ACO3AY_04590 [Chitinophagaceae bacterium]
MRYHFIANRQSIIGCLFYLVLFVSCNQTSSYKKLLRIEADAIQIDYAGDQGLKQDEFIQINGKLFWHDSLYKFQRKSLDTIFLPTQRYVVDRPPFGGRAVYSTSNTLYCLISIAEIMMATTDTAEFKVDLSRIKVGQLVIQRVGNKNVEVIASEDYPLRISALLR